MLCPWGQFDITNIFTTLLPYFQSRNLAPAEWETLADQVLKRGVQEVGERDEHFDPPPGASDVSSVGDTGVRSSRQNKIKVPQRYGDPSIPSKKSLRRNYQGEPS